MDLSFIDYKTAITIVHLFGVVLGAGGAIASDFIFFSSIKDKKITSTELRFLRVGSHMVWIGVALLVISGILIFFTDPVNYLQSSKFLSKMAIVAVVILNGIFFHLSHLPHIHRYIGQHLPTSKEFMKKSSALLVSGAVSMVSWSVAVVLGSLPSLPFSFAEIFLSYLVVVAVAASVAILSKNHILGSK